MNSTQTQNYFPTDEVNKLCQNSAITYLGLFGSYARGEQRQDSDMDILIDFNDRKTLFDLARIHLQLEKLLGKKVDLVVKRNIKPILKPYIEQDLVTVYEKN